MTLEVGKEYITRENKLVTITAKHYNKLLGEYVYSSNTGNLYYESGNFYRNRAFLLDLLEKPKITIII